MTTCKTCGGRYVSVQPDDTRYFHVCPSLSDAEVSTALGIPLVDDKRTDKQRAQLAAADRTRPNARNENVPAPRALAQLLATIPDTGGDGGHHARNQVADAAMVSAGAGVAVAPDPVLEVPK